LADPADDGWTDHTADVGDLRGRLDAGWPPAD
jgi:hypothetical protein